MYALDKTAARRGDTDGQSIKELGKYVGEFTQAKDITTKKGGRGVEFIFKTKAGQKANLAIYTTGANGEQYQGYDVLMSIIACMQLKGIRPKIGIATRYDFDTRKDVQEECSIFPDLCKPIGVLLETEDYQKQDGSTGTRMVLKHVFQAATELTASEIDDNKTQPAQLEKMVHGLRHRPLKGAKPMPTRHHDMGDDRPLSQPNDDDIPW